MEENDRVKRFLDSMLTKIGKTPGSLNREIYVKVNEIVNKYSDEDLDEALNLSVGEVGLKRLKINEFITVLIKNLEMFDRIKNQAQEEVKPIEINVENTEKISTENSEIPTNQGFKQNRKDVDRALWNVIFKKLNIPKKIIKSTELSNMPGDIANFYIASQVAKYLYSKMSTQEKVIVEKAINSQLKKLHIQSEKEIEEAKSYLLIHYVKKLYDIPY
ncbi:MAG: hypothetical protein N2Z81_01845 [Hydrogenothermaceae bacterium]|nr:hypothetical protein [Hydrogenothermaceae bacterium]